MLCGVASSNAAITSTVGRVAAVQSEALAPNGISVVVDSVDRTQGIYFGIQLGSDYRMIQQANSIAFVSRSGDVAETLPLALPLGSTALPGQWRLLSPAEVLFVPAELTATAPSPGHVQPMSWWGSVTKWAGCVAGGARGGAVGGAVTGCVVGVESGCAPGAVAGGVAGAFGGAAKGAVSC
jgi:hypothetical protein